MTSNLKEEIIELIKKLPENATIDDIMYHLYVKKKILADIEEIEQGKVIPHEQVMENAKKRLEQWLRSWRCYSYRCCFYSWWSRSVSRPLHIYEKTNDTRISFNYLNLFFLKCFRSSRDLIGILLFFLFNSIPNRIRMKPLGK
jgi:hypothetical protein